MSDLMTRIEAQALANALKYEGKANPNNVLPKILGEFPDQKARIKELRGEIDTIVAAVNAMSIDAIHARLVAIAPELLEKKVEKEKNLPPLANAVMGKVVTRIPPEPSKYNHLGHALTFLLNAIYAERYEGKVVLRFEDCNPEKVNQEYVDAMLYDITQYLGITPSEVRFVSDDMPELLRQATLLIERSGAYMCFCDQETMRANRESMTECACRSKPIAEHLVLWNEFVAGKHPKGTCVLRFVGDMASQNTVLRDPVLWRAVDAPHFRVGSTYKIWPTYDFYSPIEEHLCGVTHVLRSNEFDLRVPLQERIKELLGLPSQEVLQYGRFNIGGALTQGREIRAVIESGEYNGWDDPRLVTLKALRRRGIQAGAYRELVKKLGLSPYPITLDFSMLAAANRQIVDPVAHRYAFIWDPVEVEVVGAPHADVTLHLHPDKKNGGRTLKAMGKLFVRPDDHATFAHFKEQDVVRFNGLSIAKPAGTHTLEWLGDSAPAKGHTYTLKTASWLPADEGQTVLVEVMMPDATVKSGVAEAGLKHAKVDEIVQLERFGFCRVDEHGDDGVIRLWYAHD